MEASAPYSTETLPKGPGIRPNGEAWAVAPAPHTDYLVSDAGRVVSLKASRPRVLAVNTTHDGYDWVCLCHKGQKTSVRLNRLVYDAHHDGIPPDHDIHHRNGKARDNRLSNLEAVPSYWHRCLHTSRLSVQEAAQIRWVSTHTTASTKAIAHEYDAPTRVVKKVVEGDTWKPVSPAPPHPKRVLRILDKDQHSHE